MQHHVRKGEAKEAWSINAQTNACCGRVRRLVEEILAQAWGRRKSALPDYATHNSEQTCCREKWVGHAFDGAPCVKGLLVLWKNIRRCNVRIVMTAEHKDKDQQVSPCSNIRTRHSPCVQHTQYHKAVCLTCTVGVVRR